MVSWAYSDTRSWGSVTNLTLAYSGLPWPTLTYSGLLWPSLTVPDRFLGFLGKFLRGFKKSLSIFIKFFWSKIYFEDLDRKFFNSENFPKFFSKISKNQNFGFSFSRKFSGRPNIFEIFKICFRPKK